MRIRTFTETKRGPLYNKRVTTEVIMRNSLLQAIRRQPATLSVGSTIRGFLFTLPLSVVLWAAIVEGTLLFAQR